MVNDGDVDMDAGHDGVPEDGRGSGHQSVKSAPGGPQDVDTSDSSSSLDCSSPSPGQDSNSPDEEDDNDPESDDDSKSDNNDESDDGNEDGGGDGTRPNEDDDPMTAAVTSQVMECVPGGLNARLFKNRLCFPLKVSHTTHNNIY